MTQRVIRFELGGGAQGAVWLNPEYVSSLMEGDRGDTQITMLSGEHIFVKGGLQAIAEQINAYGAR